MPGEPAKRGKRPRPGDPTDVPEPRNVRPPSKPTPERPPPIAEIDDAEE